MKRLMNLNFHALAAALLLVSCQQEVLEPAIQEGEEASCITLELDGKLLTKADGTTPAMNVYYEIYTDQSCQTRLFPSSGTSFPTAEMPNAVKVGDDGKAYLNVELLKGKDYWFVFWAMEEGAPYTWSSLTSISLNYGTKGNADRDAFSKSVSITGGTSPTVRLVRPFAQLNFGAVLNEMGYAPGDSEAKTPCVITSWGEGYNEYLPFTSSEITIKGKFADTFNASASEATASEALSELTFSADGIYRTLNQEDRLTLDDNTGYHHVSMNYVMPTGNISDGIKGVADVTAAFTVSEGNVPVVLTHTMTNVPLEGNMRTNIIGNLFTSEGEISVELSPWTTDVNKELWDGSAEEVTPEEDNVYVVKTPEELAWIANQVNTGADDFKGKTVKLAADIDLAGSNWTPIGAAEGSNTTPYAFRGIFDGAKASAAVKSGESVECHTIFNLTVEVQDAGAGLFGQIQEGTVRNLILRNVNIRHSDRDNGPYTFSGAGAVVGNAPFGAIIENVHVYDVQIASNHYIGGIAGYLAGSIKDCSAENIILTANADDYSGAFDNGDKVGGILGYQQGPGNTRLENEISGCSVTNAAIRGTRDLGGIAGMANVAPESCSVSGLKIEADQSLLPERKNINAGAVVGRKASGYTGDETTGNTFDNVTIVEYIAKGVEKNLLGGGEYMIYHSEGMLWLADQVNTAGNTFSGQTVMVMNDIDMQNMAWTPVGTSKNSFCGTFIGNPANETPVSISNFTVNTNAFGGLFGHSTSGKFEGFSISNADITSNHYAGAAVAFHQGTGYIKNVHVSNSTVRTVPELVAATSKYDNGDKAGAIAGYFCFDAGGGELRMENCSATSVEVYAYRDAGGLVGTLNGENAYVVNNTLTECKVIVNRELDHPYVDNSPANAGEVVGRHMKGTVGDNTVSSVAVDVTYSLSELLSEEDATVTLKAGEYKLPSNIADGVTIEGVAGETVFTGTSSISGKNVTIKNVEFRNEDSERALTGALEGTVFENCHFNSEEGARYCYAHGDVVFNECTFGNEDCIRGIHFDAGDGTVTLNKCKLYGFQALGSELTKVTFNECEFLTNKNYNVVNMYNVYEFNKCVFNPQMNCDCAANYVTAVFNDCRYTDGHDITTLVRYDKDKTTCSVTFTQDGVEITATETAVE